ncbi:hypothetical protein B0O99DRAFT_747219 [Bisporella sp. PMI_857]|nr:hypothetical protein B0O99DRAFT_747219 [Bisporella sp. PMI_857]
MSVPDERWPIVWTTVLLCIHIITSAALLGLAASDFDGHSYQNWLTVWILPQSSVAVLATIVHLICVTSALLNPGWTLGYYLFLWLAWIPLTILFGYDSSGGLWDTGSEVYWEGGSTYIGISNTKLGVPKVMAELLFLCICTLSSLAIWIFCCIVVHRYRRKRDMLARRGLQAFQEEAAAIELSQPYTRQYSAQNFDPNSKVPQTTRYSLPPHERHVIEYPSPTQYPPQTYANYYPPPVQSPAQLPTHYSSLAQSPIQDQALPAPVRSPVQLPTHYSSPAQSPVMNPVHPVLIRSPVPSRKPVRSV